MRHTATPILAPVCRHHIFNTIRIIEMNHWIFIFPDLPYVWRKQLLILCCPELARTSLRFNIFVFLNMRHKRRLLSVWPKTSETTFFNDFSFRWDKNCVVYKCLTDKNSSVQFSMANAKAMTRFLLALYLIAFAILNSTEVAANPSLRNLDRLIPIRTTRALITRPPIYCRDHHDHVSKEIIVV